MKQIAIQFISLFIILAGLGSQPLKALSLQQNFQLLLTQNPQNSVDELFNQALKKAKAGDLNGAVSDYTELIRLNPNFAEAYGNRGNIYLILNDYQNALSDWDKVISINSQDALAYYNRGIVYSNLKEYDKAFTDYNKAIEINPNFAEAYGNRGLLYAQTGSKKQARSDLKKAAELLQSAGRMEEYEKVQTVLERL